MVHSVQSGQGPEPIQPHESKQERQKLFELQWEINLIGTYVAVTDKGGVASHGLEQLKKSMEHGASPESLTPQVNQVIDLLNQGLSEGEAPLPQFALTSVGGEAQAMTQFALSMEKFFNVAAQKGLLERSDADALFNATRTLIDKIGAIPLVGAKEGLNQIVEGANQSLALPYQLHQMEV